MSGGFTHHVLFWLRQSDDLESRDALIAGLRRLATAKDIQSSHIGIPADTDRPTIDRSYGVSWLVTFADIAAQDRYQRDPVHLAFVKECRHLWSTEVIYDSVPA